GQVARGQAVQAFGQLVDDQVLLFGHRGGGFGALAAGLLGGLAGGLLLLAQAFHLLLVVAEDDQRVDDGAQLVAAVQLVQVDGVVAAGQALGGAGDLLHLPAHGDDREQGDGAGGQQGDEGGDDGDGLTALGVGDRGGGRLVG